MRLNILLIRLWTICYNTESRWTTRNCWIPVVSPNSRSFVNCPDRTLRLHSQLTYRLSCMHDIFLICIEFWLFNELSFIPNNNWAALTHLPAKTTCKLSICSCCTELDNNLFSFIFWWLHFLPCIISTFELTSSKHKWLKIRLCIASLLFTEAPTAFT